MISLPRLKNSRARKAVYGAIEVAGLSSWSLVHQLRLMRQ